MFLPLFPMKRKLLSLSLLSAMVMAGCSAATVDDGTGPIKIGFIGPLTGDIAAPGNDLLNGVQWAVKEVNDAGGINGRNVQLITEDGRCTGAEAASAAQKLVNVNRATAIIGGLCSGETLAAAPIAEAGKVVLLSPASSSPDVTNAGDFVFRNYPSDALKTAAMAAYFKKEGYGKVAIISENTDFSQAFRAALKEKIGEEAVVFDEVVEPGTKDFRTLFTRLKDEDFDVFFVNPNGDAVLGVMVQQFRAAGFTQPAISHDVAESLAIADIAGSAAEGLRLINVPSSGEGSEFETAYRAAYGAPQASITWAAYGYDAAHIVLNAIAEHGNSGASVRDALYGLKEYNGIVGKIHFDRNGDVVGIPYALKEFQNGKIVKIEDIAVN